MGSASIWKRREDGDEGDESEIEEREEEIEKKKALNQKKEELGGG